MLEADTAGQSSVRLHLIGTLISAILYGLLVPLCFQILVWLVTKKNSLYSNRTRHFLILYTVAMFLQSTAAIIQAFVFITNAVLHGVEPTSSRSLLQIDAPITLPMAVWGSDAFKLWRCIKFYADTSKLQRSILYVILTLTTLASLGGGILFYISPHLSTTFTSGHTWPFWGTTISISITAGVNCTLTALIAGRLWTHQDEMRRILGPHYGTPYINMIVTCVESCTMIVLTSLAHVVLFSLGNRKEYGSSIIPLLLLPHICTLAPMMVVYHVVRRRAATTVKLSDIVTPNLAWSGKPIQFNHSISVLDTSAQPLTRRHSIGSLSMHSRSQIQK